MGILSKLFGKREKREDISWEAVALAQGGGASTAAENLSTVLACVNAISGSLASLPVYVHRLEQAGRVVDWDHPVQRLVDLGPNQWQSWPEFVEWLAASALLRGNALAEVVTDARGAPVELIPHEWSTVSVHKLGSGRLQYEIEGNGNRRRLLQEEVLHLRDRSDDGIVGRSRLSRASEVVEANQTLQRFSRRIYDNGVSPSGVVEADETVGPEQVEKLRSRFKQAFSGASNAGSALILDQGLKWKQLGVSPEDAELLSSRRFSVEEMARLFGVPPPVVGHLDQANYSNVSVLTRFYAKQCLMPWIRKLEECFKRYVFSSSARRTHELKFDLSGLLRGDPEQRWQAHQIAVQNGILTADEVRKVEGWNPRGSSSRSTQQGTERRSLDELTPAQRDALERKLEIRSRYRPRIRDRLQPIIQEDAEAVLQALESGNLDGLMEQFDKRGGDNGDVANALADDAKAMEGEVRQVVQDETGEIVDHAGPFVAAALGSLGTGYAAANRAQVQALKDYPDQLKNRAEEWLEKRVDDLADKTSVRIEAGVSHRLYRKAGRRKGTIVNTDAPNQTGSLDEPFRESGDELESDLYNPPLEPGDNRVMVAD
jgi:HK97 family phage portal protein